MIPLESRFLRISKRKPLRSKLIGTAFFYSHINMLSGDHIPGEGHKSIGDTGLPFQLRQTIEKSEIR